MPLSRSVPLKVGLLCGMTNRKSYLDKWVTQESKDTVWIKGAYMKDNGSLGVNVWPIDGGDVHGKCGSKQILLKYVHGGLGNHPNFD